MVAGCRVRLPGSSVVEPLVECLAGEVVERTDPGCDDEPAIAEVDVIDKEVADCVGAGGVNRSEGEGERCGGGCRSREGVGDLVGLQRQEHAVVLLPDMGGWPDSARSCQSPSVAEQ